MGFWKKILEKTDKALDCVANNVVKTVKYTVKKSVDAYNCVADKVKKTADAVSDACDSVTNFVNKTVDEYKNKICEAVFKRVYRIYDAEKRNRTESEEKAAVAERNQIVTDYMRMVERDANYRETTLKEMYLNMYNLGILDSFDDGLFDTTEIRLYIEKQSRRFDHIMRDEINSLISPKELKERADDFQGSVDEFDKKINEFAENVYNEAKIHLEDLFVEIVNETKETIGKEAEKYLRDEQDTLKGLMGTLQNLNGTERKREEELKAISEEICAMWFIINDINDTSSLK